MTPDEFMLIRFYELSFFQQVKITCHVVILLNLKNHNTMPESEYVSV